MTNRNDIYASELSDLIRRETVSGQAKSKFTDFQGALRDMFPHLFRAGEAEFFEGSLLLHWKGESDADPIMLMNHHDVVAAEGEWKYPPFSGEIAEGKVWGRGALDAKGGLWAMLRAADELAAEDFVPKKDIYFFTSCNEETTGHGAETVSRIFKNRGMKFSLVLERGGMMVYDPIGGADGTFALVGVGEKECVELKFIARSHGGHAATPGHDTPLVRLGKFMAAVEDSDIFTTDIPEELFEMFKRLGARMKRPMRGMLSHPRLFKNTIARSMPTLSDSAGAMVKTTLAFTMAQGSGGVNVLPQEAWVIGDMRCAHHQGSTASLAAVKSLADRFDIDMVVLSRGMASPLTDTKSEAFKLVERAVENVFPGVTTLPYLMTGASDCRFMSRICDNCLRFTPFLITMAQLDSIHGVNENIDIECLAPAVDFYKYIISEV